MVHCHAGYGRTGVVIACYLIYISTHSTEQVIDEIRKHRKQCIQKKEQYEFCERFKQYIHSARILYNLSFKESMNMSGSYISSSKSVKSSQISKNSNTHKKPIEFYMKNQYGILFGAEAKKFESIPKLIYKCLEKLLQAKRNNNIDNITFYSSLSAFEKWDSEHEEVLTVIKVS